MKLKVTLAGGKIREFPLNKINIVPHPENGPALLNLSKKDNKYDMFVSSNLIPATDLFEKIEIVE